MRTLNEIKLIRPDEHDIGDGGEYSTHDHSKVDGIPYYNEFIAIDGDKKPHSVSAIARNVKKRKVTVKNRQTGEKHKQDISPETREKNWKWMAQVLYRLYKNRVKNDDAIIPVPNSNKEGVAEYTKNIAEEVIKLFKNDGVTVYLCDFLHEKEATGEMIFSDPDARGLGVRHPLDNNKKYEIDHEMLANLEGDPTNRTFWLLDNVAAHGSTFNTLSEFINYDVDIKVRPMLFSIDASNQVYHNADDSYIIGVGKSQYPDTTADTIVTKNIKKDYSGVEFVDVSSILTEDNTLRRNEQVVGVRVFTYKKFWGGKEYENVTIYQTSKRNINAGKYARDDDNRMDGIRRACLFDGKLYLRADLAEAYFNIHASDNDDEIFVVNVDGKTGIATLADDQTRIGRKHLKSIPSYEEMINYLHNYADVLKDSYGEYKPEIVPYKVPRELYPEIKKLLQSVYDKYGIPLVVGIDHSLDTLGVVRIRKRYDQDFDKTAMEYFDQIAKRLPQIKRLFELKIPYAKHF